MKVRGGSEQIDFDEILFSADLEIFQSPSFGEAPVSVGVDEQESFWMKKKTNFMIGNRG